MLIRITLVVALVAGCGGSRAVGKQAGKQVLTLAQAHALVNAYDAKQARDQQDDPLRQPKTLEQGQEILRRDQNDLFQIGIEFASQLSGKEAEALHAQLELAWGAAQEALVYLLRNLDDSAAAAIDDLEQRAAGGEASPADKARVGALRASMRFLDLYLVALTVAGHDHVERGAELAKQLTDKYPDDYLGYRVAADYYRSTGDWEQFTAMVDKIRATNPNSNGLTFLLGVAAAERDGDSETAAELFEKALEEDPKFVRAQASLLLVQTSLEGSNRELQKLRALNPRHQMVTWAAPMITALYELEQNRPPAAETPAAEPPAAGAATEAPLE